MRIERVIAREIEMSLRSPFRAATGTTTTRRLVLVELEAEEGLRGWAECVAGAVPGYVPETVESAWAAITGRLGALLVGADSEDAAAAVGAAAPDQPMASAAVEMACWDLTARARGLSLARLLGGRREKVATGIALGIPESAAAAAAAATAAIREGYRRVKLKIEPGADLEVVRAVRVSLGNAPVLAVDANGSYTAADIDHLVALDEFELGMIEQPLPAGDLEGHAALQARIRTPLCLDESIEKPADVDRMAGLGAGRIINLKPGRVGGFAAALAVVESAARQHLRLWCGGMLETGIGRAHNVALASLDALTLPGDLSPSSRYWERDLVDPPWTMVDGHLLVPLDRPGLGVEVDVEFVDRCTLRRREMRAP